MKVLEGKWCFVSTQKCATNTMYKILPGTRRHSFHHMPTSRVAPLHWSIVRNPYDRAVSLYGSTALREGDRYNVKKECGSEHPDFITFVDRCLITPQNKWVHQRKQTHKYLFRNQSDWIDSGIIDQVVHLENLHQDILNLIGLDLELPRENSSTRQGWEKYMTPEVIEMLNNWAGDDFRYGYEKL